MSLENTINVCFTRELDVVASLMEVDTILVANADALVIDNADALTYFVVKSTISRMVVGLRDSLHIWWLTPRSAVPYLQSSARFVDRSERERLFHFANVTLYRSL
jgi:hypothetical protein